MRLQRDQPEVWEVNCAIEFISVIEASKLIAMSLSRLRVGLRRHLHDFWCQHRLMCTHFSIFTTCTIILCSYWGYGQVFIIISTIIIILSWLPQYPTSCMLSTNC